MEWLPGGQGLKRTIKQKTKHPDQKIKPKQPHTPELAKQALNSMIWMEFIYSSQSLNY